MKIWKRILSLIFAALMFLTLSACAAEDLAFFLDVLGALGNAGYGDSVTIDPDGLRVIFMDVKQADCALIIQGSHAMLVDTGTSDQYETIADYLDQYGVRQLDALVLTHPHADHIGSAPEILENYEVSQVFLPNAAANTKVFERTLDLILEQEIPTAAPIPGETWQLGQAVLTFLSPPEDAEFSDINDSSITFILDYNGIGMMFTGDMGKAMEKIILEEGYHLQCDLIKVPHHGSRTASSADFVEAVSPEYAIFTTEEDSRDGLPDEDVVERYEAIGSTLYFSHIDGTVIAEVDGADFYVYPEG